MAKLSDYILYPEVKSLYRNRYSANGYFIAWANQLLEELEERGFLSTTIKEVGQIVHDKVWIVKPSDLVELKRVYDPQQWDHEFRVEDVNNEFKLCDDVFREIDSSIVSSIGIASFTTSEITCILTNAIAANQFKNYLMYITAGNKKGTGLVIGKNDVSVYVPTPIAGQYTNFYFVNSQSFVSGDVTAVEFIPPGQYVMIRYDSLINQIATVDDEVPIPDFCEARLVSTWLRWGIEKEVLSTSKETNYWQGEAMRLLNEIDVNHSSRPNPAKGRRLIGLERRGRFCKGQPVYDSWTDTWS